MGNAKIAKSQLRAEVESAIAALEREHLLRRMKAGRQVAERKRASQRRSEEAFGLVRTAPTVRQHQKDCQWEGR